MVEMTDALLWRYLDGELPQAERTRIERAASDDAVLAERIARQRLLREAVLDGAPRPPAGFAAKVAAHVRLRGAGGSAHRLAPNELLEMRRFMRRVLAAATILAVVGLAYLAVDVAPALIDRLAAASDPLLDQR
jgi:anti-sigma factor RsiW